MIPLATREVRIRHRVGGLERVLDAFCFPWRGSRCNAGESGLGGLGFARTDQRNYETGLAAGLAAQCEGGRREVDA